LQKFNIEKELGRITSDNASNNTTMCKDLERRLLDYHGHQWDSKAHHIACLAHIINLAVQAFLENIKVTPPTENDPYKVPASSQRFTVAEESATHDFINTMKNV